MFVISVLQRMTDSHDDDDDDGGGDGDCRLSSVNVHLTNL